MQVICFILMVPLSKYSVGLAGAGGLFRDSTVSRGCWVDVHDWYLPHRPGFTYMIGIRLIDKS